MGHSKVAFIFLLLALSVASWGQTTEGSASKPAPSPKPTPNSSSGDEAHPASDNPVQFLRNLAQDQKTIWTSPFKIKVKDLNWLVPMAGLTAGLINADAELSSRINPTNTFAKHGSTI